MNFDFSPDQQELRDHVRKLLAGVCPLGEVRRILEGAEPYSAPVWRRLGELGYLGAAIPAQYGGLGLGHLELCVIAEELGRALAPVPFRSSTFAAELLLLAGSQSQRERLLPALASGSSIACVAFDEPGGRSRPDAMTAVLQDGRLSGIKAPVLDGGIARHAIVLCGGGPGASLALVDLTGPRIRRETLHAVDPASDCARLHFAQAAAEPLGEPGDGWRIFEAARDRVAVLTAFEQLGGAERSLEMARDYALQRYAFGRQIGSFQAVKHKLVDMHVMNTMARGHAYYGAWALSTNAPDLPLAAAAARASASQAFSQVAQESIHVHGGIGFTWEHDCHLFLKRARLLGTAFGNIHEWKDRLVTLLEQKHPH